MIWTTTVQSACHKRSHKNRNEIEILRIKRKIILNYFLTLLLLNVNDWKKSGNLEGPIDVACSNAVHRSVDDPALEVPVSLDIVEQTEMFKVHRFLHKLPLSYARDRNSKNRLAHNKFLCNNDDCYLDRFQKMNISQSQVPKNCR